MGDFEETEVKGDAYLLTDDTVLRRIATHTMLWHLIRRHKFALVLIWAITITTFYVFPFLDLFEMSV